MKQLKYFTLVLLSVLMASCDENKSKVKEVATQFVSAVVSKDKVVINEMYPNAKTYSVLQIVDSINSESVEVEFNEKDSIYIAKLNDKQSLVVKIKDENDIAIMDSYGILKLDSAAYDLAAKTSAPITKQSDLTNGKLFSDEGEFVQYLSGLYPSAANGNLYSSHLRYSWTGGSYPTMTFESPVTNGGNTKINGSDYNVEIAYHRGDTGECVGTSVEHGVDLEPIETYIFTTYKNELYCYNPNHPTIGGGINWVVYFNFKNASTATMLAKYGSFTGKEYDEFVKQQTKSKKSK